MLPAGPLPNPSSGNARPELTLGVVAGGSVVLGRKTFAPKVVHEVNLDERVPQDHLLRRIAEVVDFSFVRRLTARFYSHTGQPGIDPVVLFKMALVGYLYGITSERRLAEELRLHLAFKL